MNSMLYEDLYGNFRNRTFSDIWDSVDTFKADLNNCGIPMKLNDTSLTTLYYLLYSRYGNSTVASSDENRFKYAVAGIIFESGPVWEKKLELQDKLRNLTEDEITMGAKAIYNHAYNPNTKPTTDTLNELPYINEQNTTKFKKSKLEGYAILTELLNQNITSVFLKKFDKLFIFILEPEQPLWYATKIEGEEK